IEQDAIFVSPPENGVKYPPGVGQPGWILVHEHLMGRTIYDIDGRRTEVVNDVHLLESKGRMLLIHVDISFNGFLRKWRLAKLLPLKDQLVSWRYVQPLSVEDATQTDAVSLSITRKQLRELPSEDLADALEELSGDEQQAVFSALDSEKAAETLMDAEPRAQRQLMAHLREERARTILSEMSVTQLADLLSVLPHDELIKMMDLLPKDKQQRIQALISNREATAATMISTDYVAVSRDAKVGQVLASIRNSGRDHAAVSYLYVVVGDDKLLIGVVDLRDLVLAPDSATMGDIMNSPVVSAEEDFTREDLAEMFAKYHYRMIPVVTPHDHLLGVIRYHDIMRGPGIHVRL
ncbi:MAG: CBS domain-containing protein, partial [Bacillota bacterium]